MTEAPWSLGDGHVENLRAAGVSDEGMAQTAAIGAIFGYLPRVADATGIEFDYDSPLERLHVDLSRDALPRPHFEQWPGIAPGLPPLLAAKMPATAAAFGAWHAYIFERDHSISRRDRAVLARAASWATCDATEVEFYGDATARTPREEAFAAFATKLSLTPWRMVESDLGMLRNEGLDDVGILDVGSVVSFENAWTRLRMSLAVMGPGDTAAAPAS